MGVGVGEELVEEDVGGFECEDVVGGEQGREPLLPVVVAALDFAFGLGRGGVAQGDAVKVEGFAELGEGVGTCTNFFNCPVSSSALYIIEACEYLKPSYIFLKSQ